MAYYTGTATSAADLIIAICNAAVANAWTKTATGDILYKGNVYAQLSQWNPRDNNLTDKGVGVQAGLGESEGVLTTPSDGLTGIRTDLQTSYGATALTYPCTYYIFINTSPDEIVVAVNFSSLYWMWLAFGQSTTIGITGTGVYCWGSCFPGAAGSDINFGFNICGQAIYYNQYPCFYGAPIYNYVLGANAASSHIHLGLDSLAWWNNHRYDQTQIVSVKNSVGDILQLQPNTWNSEALLVRTQILARRADSFWSYVAELPHFRYVRNTFFDDGEGITLGTDNWFVAPIYKKNLVYPEGISTAAKFQSGTSAFAVRKTA